VVRGSPDPATASGNAADEQLESNSGHEQS
jgi:hypothetical protein